MREALDDYNAFNSSDARQSLNQRVLRPAESEEVHREDAQKIGVVLDAAAAVDPVERQRHLDAVDLAKLHVHRATACLRRPLTRERAGLALEEYRALAQDPERSGLDRRDGFKAYAQASLSFSQLCASAARDLVAARRLVPDRVDGVDALSQAMEQPVPAASQPMAHALYACFEVVEWASGELTGLGRDRLLDLEATAPGLESLLVDFRSLFLATNMIDHLENFHEATFHRLMAPSMDDLREAALDVMSLAIQSPLAGQADERDAVQTAAQVFVTGLLQSATLFVDMIELAPSTVTRAHQAPRGAALQMSLRTDRGDHVPVQLQVGGLARGLADAGQQFRRGDDGQWRAVDTDLQQALEPEPIEEHITRLSLGAMAGVAGVAGAQRTQRHRDAQRLLSLDFIGDMGRCLDQARTTFPLTLAHRYQALQDRWTARAAVMLQVHDQLDLLQAESGIADDTTQALVDGLRHRAEQIQHQFEALPAKGIHLEFIKCHGRPQSALWSALLEAGEAVPEAPRALMSSEPGTLYEIALRPMRHGGPMQDSYQPAVFVHLHLKEAREPTDLADLRVDDLLAGHLKSHAQRSLGAQWQLQQRQAGQYDARVHRSPIDDRMLDRLFGRSG